jgi:hypothetical protein
MRDFKKLADEIGQLAESNPLRGFDSYHGIKRQAESALRRELGLAQWQLLPLAAFEAAVDYVAELDQRPGRWGHGAARRRFIKRLQQVERSLRQGRAA